MSELQVKPLNYKELPGLSERQLSEHHDVLYAGYVKKVNEIRAALANVDLSKSNGTYSDLRELKVEEGFALNGVKLHEAYFDNMTPQGQQPAGDIAGWIAADFGSYEKWAADFAACGLAARGWVVLAFDLADGKLHNYVCDIHNQGGVWGAIPLLVLDVYEHAYFLDYATARKKYVDGFMTNLDWNVANGLIAKYELNKHRK
ncbi:MAG TPA: Fe-Mn family superoxide dismutase [Candidatus Eisenbacteria bacterium]|jgi:Fe-Mn family superoxide dismutase|nr:Fe-Mn family superoxide dismutase [Candidatus Eisenbacteria bacterium]